MKILVRLPNWLGDMVMSVGFLNQLRQFYPAAEISVIAKKGLHQLLPLFPKTQHQFVLDKKEYKGLTGLWKFGKQIKATETFDLFFCLPNSFSSAFMGYATGIKKRIGYRKEWRQLFLTHSYKKPENIHRAEEYVMLLEAFTKQAAKSIDVKFFHPYVKKNYVVVNINSEAASRKLTIKKATEIISHLRTSISEKIILIGSEKEKDFVGSVWQSLPDKNGIENKAGETTLPQLAEILASANLLVTTDSGPAHLSNALGTRTIVLFGAGNEAHTAPYNPEFRHIIRLGKLACEPCEKNICVRYGIPQCLEQLNTNQIIQMAKQHLYE